MCNFLSGAINFDGDVFIISPEDSLKVSNPDSHDQIFKFFSLSDNDYESDKIINCKFEYIPPNNDPFSPLEDWSFKIDEDRTPDWWSEFHLNQVKSSVKKYLQSYLVQDQEIKFLGGKRCSIKDSTISNLNNCIVDHFFSGTIREIHGGTIKEIHGGTIKEIYGGTIHRVYGGTIEKIYSDTIQEIHGGTIQQIWGGTIQYIRGGTIKEIYSGTIQKIWGGTIQDILGGTITYYKDLPRNINGDSAVCICKFNNTIETKNNKFQIT